MKKMKILFQHIKMEYWHKKIDELKKDFPDLEFIFEKTPENLEKIDLYLGGNIFKEDFEHLNNLKAIFVPYSGVNTLPKKEIQERNIVVSNARGNGRVVAERAVAMTLALLGKIPHYHKDLTHGIWHGFTVFETTEDSWTSIIEKRIGILGTGSIGENIAKYLKPFDCHITGFVRDINKEIKNFDELSDNLDYVIENSDIIFIALPLTESTRNIINEEKLNKMKDKFLINIARGPVVSEKDLYESIKNGILAGAAIDVWYDYPTRENLYKLPSKYPIHTFENVIVSPHVAGYNSKAVQFSIDATVENIRSYLKTGNPKTPVDLNKI